MCRILTILVLATGGLFAAAPEQPDPAAGIYRELGLPAPVVVAKLPAEYLPDNVAEADIKKDPKRFPVRAAVLSVVEILEQTRSSVPGTLVLRQDDAFGSVSKKRIRDLQEPPAIAIALLEEARQILASVESKRGKERLRRWQAHFDYLAAEVEFRIALNYEYNELLAVIIRDDMPAIEAGTGQVGWRLVRTEKMRSREKVRKLVEAAHERFERIILTEPGTPWAELAERYRETPAGFQWLPMTDLIDP